jgi:hypothetical protein
MPNWKDLLSNRERRGFPEVVVPLAHGSAPLRPKDESDCSPDRASLQEKGASGAHSGTTLTLEALRAEVEDGIAATGHDTVYDRMFMIVPTGLIPDLEIGLILP